MACSLNNSVCVSGFNESINKRRANGPSIGNLQFTGSKSSLFLGKFIELGDHHKGLSHWNVKASSNFSVNAMKWWEKTVKSNMIEIHSAQELVDFLLNSGDKLVVVDFFSPGCGGCRALHPKICQLAESNPDTIFLKVNYEELKTMCHSLDIHVVPYFRFYRGVDGQLCSFSCTNATIKKFKEAIAKYGTEKYSVGPAKGLDDSELVALALADQLSWRNLKLQSNMGLEESKLLQINPHLKEIKFR